MTNAQLKVLEEYAELTKDEKIFILPYLEAEGEKSQDVLEVIWMLRKMTFDDLIHIKKIAHAYIQRQMNQ